ncbi:hypothetical protein [Streptomyces sp. PU-14G]|uniref:hypothetical protein n=1 Tax=Streptomyces sp. PU-14G TaxID=2800808 RepID=UPI0034DEC487
MGAFPLSHSSGSTSVPRSLPTTPGSPSGSGTVLACSASASHARRGSPVEWGGGPTRATSRWPPASPRIRDGCPFTLVSGDFISSVPGTPNATTQVACSPRSGTPDSSATRAKSSPSTCGPLSLVQAPQQ